MEGPLHQMSWPVQIKEVFDVLQSSPDSILDPTDPEIKMHLLEPGEFSVLDMTADQETRSYTEKLWLANLGTSVPLKSFASILLMIGHTLKVPFCLDDSDSTQTIIVASCQSYFWS